MTFMVWVVAPVLQEYELPVFPASRVCEIEPQMVVSLPKLTTGNAFTVKAPVSLAVQPLMSVTSTM